MTSINLRPVQSTSSSSSSSSKPIPSPGSLKPWDFSYSPSSDGNDINLLIMFHGLGDSKTPFFGLAKQLNLPSTAILSLSAPDPIPLMDHPSYSWYPTFTSTYDPLPIENHNPTVHLDKLRMLITKLCSKEIGWKLNEVHLFGWGQGGTIALELGLSIGKSPLQIPSSDGKTQAYKRLGSIISICAPLLTHPTSSLELETPICNFTRYKSNSSIHAKQKAILNRVFKKVEFVHAPNQGNVEAMPRNKDEWWGVMKFWGQILIRKDQGWKGSGEVYEVVQ
ncbi:uncharacterized protein L201_005479 [Kwoniella dendrophila CBS 6074]|uniref:Phospholipase/carboxylesterase/thioesterase domain-containing protein n=1 Tax=Kwoniella dendrophila CBS 6074 TaxID=1295534 RepID=A0AAX4K0H8_9TREE